MVKWNVKFWLGSVDKGLVMNIMIDYLFYLISRSHFVNLAIVSFIYFIIMVSKTFYHLNQEEGVMIICASNHGLLLALY